MAENNDNRRRHLFPKQSPTTERFTSPRTVVNRRNVPAQDRAVHGPALLSQLAQIQEAEQDTIDAFAQAELGGVGIQIEFSSFVDAELVVQQLADERRGITLSNVRAQPDGSTLATVWVPQGALTVFENKVHAYIAGRPPGTNVRDYQTLIDAIKNIRIATFASLWTDDDAVLPEDINQSVWWEAWLPNVPKRQSVLDDFRQVAKGLGLRASDRQVIFPERIVVLVQASRAQLHNPIVLSMLAEIRRARDTAEFFNGMSAVEQVPWVEDLAARLEVPDDAAPVVCLLDTGVNRGHPLLQYSLPDEKVLTVDHSWGRHDAHGHGTELAGLALFGDLQAALTHGHAVNLTHHLESVKILNSGSGNEDKEFGSLTIDAVAQPEVRDAQRSRVFCMAVTSETGRDRGRPSAWSATIDRLASDWINDGETCRLFCISAGNIQDNEAWLRYPAPFAESDYGLESPGQAWNALTIGAYTEKHQIDEEDAQHYTPVAQPGLLSPFSSTSAGWDKDWPWKPDVVFEGGNAARDGVEFACYLPSLALLTAHFEPADRLLTVSWATSASTALAAHMAGTIMATYPTLWPETVRALMVHSARWTPLMLEHYRIGSTPSRQHVNLLRHCGYGVPDLERALWSVSNSLTLLIQESIQPFIRMDGESTVKTCDMHLHDLPWPRDILEALGETEVRMRVTLSYFIEPNPGERGFKDKYSYQSHGLRFDVRRRTETEAGFRARINRRARDEEYDGADADQGWMLGDLARRRGSLHSDVWVGSAADLANRGQIAIYPSTGWWKTRPGLRRFNQKTRYALAVSIEAPEVAQDIYAEIETQIAASIPIEITL
ncbi:S8 family peptidase [Pusillimonas caeni]|uniref:S8 family peptidase n=1 Tax=Pusillimonas caeni TaxID=1348472 RepID=UPI001ADDBB83|nr:S8 family peptidase [Pusillimonas caeni]